VAAGCSFQGACFVSLLDLRNGFLSSGGVVSVGLGGGERGSQVYGFVGGVRVAGFVSCSDRGGGGGWGVGGREDWGPGFLLNWC